MRRFRHSTRLAVTVLSGTLVMLFVPGAPAHAKAAAAGSTYVVGVDMATPAGHNIAGVDYFPRGDATYPLAVTPGPVINFKWNARHPHQLPTARVPAPEAFV